jgi:glycerate kinase
MGLRFAGSEGLIRQISPQKWASVVRIEGSLPSLPPIRIACDVDNPLLGPRGAARVYGPQKGLRDEDFPDMEVSMARMARMLCDFAARDAHAMTEPGAGAAGGMGFGLRTVAGASFVSGFELVSKWLRLRRRMDACSVAITGEGRFDASSWEGKGPGSLCRWARESGKRVIVLAGSIDDGARQAAFEQCASAELRSIAPTGMSLDQAIRQGPRLLKQAAKEAMVGCVA